MIQHTGTALRMLACFALVSGLFGEAARAQDTLRVGGDEALIRVEDGRVFVNGREVTAGDEVVVRVRPDRSVQSFSWGDAADPRWQEKLEERLSSLRSDLDVRTFFPDHGTLGTFFYGDDGEAPFAFFNDGTFFGGEALREGRAELFRMEQEAQRMAEAVRRVEGEERERLRTELRAHLADIFQLKLRQRTERIERLRETLREQEAHLDERQRMQDEIIDRRLRELLREQDVYEW